MPLDRLRTTTNLIDVLDRVLDKGIVIDAWVRVSLTGIDLLTVESRVIVASIGSYLTYAGGVTDVAPASRRQPRVVSDRTPTLEEQLRRIRERLDAASVLHEPEPRRAADRILEDLRDARARIVQRPPREHRRLR
jgi:hypothetical protein